MPVESLFLRVKGFSKGFRFLRWFNAARSKGFFAAVVDCESFGAAAYMDVASHHALIIHLREIIHVQSPLVYPQGFCILFGLFQMGA